MTNRCFVSVGKSNVMDAISFVLGLDVKKLRGDSLGDLVNEAARKEREDVESFVRLVFVTGDGQRLQFKRSIVFVNSPTKGKTWKSAFEFDGEAGRAHYEAGLGRIGISAQHPNYLVFQVRQIPLISETILFLSCPHMFFITILVHLSHFPFTHGPKISPSLL